jgi:hypothetical protein
MSELAEGARLEIVCAVYSGTEGSNPSLSATQTNPAHPTTPGHPMVAPKTQVRYKIHMKIKQAISFMDGSI